MSVYFYYSLRVHVGFQPSTPDFLLRAGGGSP